MANSRRKCKGCGEYGKVSEGIVNRAGYFHDDECLSLFISKNKEKMINKGRAKIAKEERKEIKKAKEGLKTKSDHTKDAQKAFNRYVRARDKFFNRNCPSCEKSILEIEAAQSWKTGGAWDAGHFKSRGAKAHLRFNLLNCWRQCKSCNGGSGKYSHKDETVSKRYKQTLIERIGLERVEALENDNSLRSFDIDYLKRVKKIFNKRARWYEKRVNK